LSRARRLLSWAHWGQWLAAAGFAVFCPNPRGGKGHGHAFAVMYAGIADWAIQVAEGELGRTDHGLCGSFGWDGPGPHRHDQLSPVSYAAKVSTPVLILHGENDTNVPVGQAMYFHRALTHFGVEHDLVIYPDENHSLTRRAHQVDVLERVRSWFTRWLVDPGQPRTL
jgi:dipeptidyl aminopeptidase/acylaminoacyl peptidase